MAGHDHTLFTLVYRAVAGAGERTGLGELRRRVLESATGRLLIIGLGPGHDLDHLPPAVTSVLAVEPSASMRAAAQSRVQAARDRGMEVEVIDAVGEALPIPDDSVDAVLLAYVLCTVSDVEATLAEVRRVLRPGGVVCVMEHVRAREGTWLRTSQRLVAPVWPRIAGGCHADRDTRAALERAGFDRSGLRDVSIANLPPLSATLIGTTRVQPVEMD
jgi:ubiquinone/menaquinone biosynthesis C-methylase UbiE